jgi:phospholipase/carboxylesterase
MLDYDLIAARRPAVAPDQGWLCLILHGLGDTKRGWQPVAPMLGLDGMTYAFAQAPFFYYGGGSWFELDQDFRPNDSQVRESRAMLDELVTHLLARTGIPRSHLFVLGFSQGALMTLDWGLRQAEPCAGLIPVSGFVTMLDEYPAALGAGARRQPILMTHGHDDQVIPISATRRQKDALLSLGLDLDWREYAKAHHIDEGDELPELRAWLAERMR